MDPRNTGMLPQHVSGAGRPPGNGTAATAALLRAGGLAAISRWRITRTLAMMMSLAMVVSGFTMPRVSAPERGTGTDRRREAGVPAGTLSSLYQLYEELRAALRSSAPRSPDARAERLEYVFEALEAGSRGLRRETFDVAAAADSIGNDPAALFTWVRDRTWWVPYHGVLRGPAGVLMDRVGNSLDRSLLLAALLFSSGHTARLVHADLTEQEARTLQSRVRAMPESRFDQAADNTAASTSLILRAYSARFGLESAGILEKATRFHEAWAGTSAAIARRTEAQAAAILDQVGPAAAPEEQTDTNAVTALRDHWWVQLMDGGVWMDLDPLVPDARPGLGITQATETFIPDEDDGAFPLSAKLRHEVVLHVVIEQRTGKGLSERTVLSHTLRPADLIGRPVVLFHAPQNPPEELASLTDGAVRPDLQAILANLHEWTPVLQVGDEHVVQSSFSTAGEVGQRSSSGSTSATRPSGSMVGGIGALSGEAGRKNPGQAGELTAEWIDFDVRSPGRPARTIRREIFDVIGPAARAAGRVALTTPTADQRARRTEGLLDQTAVLTMGCVPAHDFVAHVIAAGLLDQRDQILAAVRGEPGEPPRNAATGISAALVAWAEARMRFSRVASDVYLDRPNILNYRIRSILDGNRGLRISEFTDIVANNVAVRKGSRLAPFRVRIEQGIVDTLAEGFVLSGPPAADSAAQFLERAAAAGNPLVIVRGVDDQVPARIGMPEDVRARVRADSRDGAVALVPSQPIQVDGTRRFGWWQVDLRTGRTVGTMDTGFRQAGLEYAKVKKAAEKDPLGAAIYLGVMKPNTIGLVMGGSSS
ncbi:MAG: hypothetical protein IMZ55_07515 [Acidobacteria bacterium]|nr:hypothetical protein [Acidobacteriota bacterium]